LSVQSIPALIYFVFCKRFLHIHFAT